MNKLVLYLTLLILQTSYAQDVPLNDRIRAIDNGAVTFYNADGHNFSSELIDANFDEKGLKKDYRQYSIKKKEVKQPDQELPFENFRVVKKLQKDGLTAMKVNYFVQNKQGAIEVFAFGYHKERDIDFERKVISMVINEMVPENAFSPMTTERVDFAGRELALGGVCNWMNVNNIQCPYYGQMNWSLHPNIESSNRAVESQLATTKAKNGGKIISEEKVEIEFEGVPTMATKAIYDITGVNSLLAGMTGGKTLTIYYVAEEIRGNFISCVLSFWNNDNINESGLPQLLDEVMKLD